MLQSFMSSRYGGYILMLAMLGLVIGLLRFLFGPGGLFRDPRWDESNRRLRAEEEEERKARREAWEKAQGGRD